VNNSVAEKPPAARLVTLEVRLTVTAVAGPPRTKVPLVGETLNHEEVFTRLQFNEPIPMFVNEYVCVAGLKGPPTGPVKVLLPDGEIRNGSGSASAVRRLLPLGVPQPVQRS
jgi:hypothetical protein